GAVRFRKDHRQSHVRRAASVSRGDRFRGRQRRTRRAQGRTPGRKAWKASATATGINNQGALMINWTYRALAVSRPRAVLLVALVLGITLVVRGAFVDEYKSGIEWPEPKVIDPGPIGGPPSDAVVLFDGKDLSKWEQGDKWEIKDGYAIAREA